MSITVKRLKELLSAVSDDVRVNAYEGEDVGLVLYWPKTGAHAWIRARESEEEDDYVEGINGDSG